MAAFVARYPAAPEPNRVGSLGCAHAVASRFQSPLPGPARLGRHVLPGALREPELVGADGLLAVVGLLDESGEPR